MIDDKIQRLEREVRYLRSRLIELSEAIGRALAIPCESLGDHQLCVRCARYKLCQLIARHR